jgi:oxygen-dependent protoporphyrinogen oxidase
VTQPSGQRHVVVVGGGIAGLAAAHELLRGPNPPRVTVLEADDRVGGKIRTTPFAGHAAIDEGADAFLARVPHATDLARQVGLGASLTSPAAGRAAVWWNGLQTIPEGLLLGMPTDVLALARSSLLPWSAKLRAATEPLRRRTDTSDDSLGHYVRRRFGKDVHLRLVDPLVGSIYAADTDHFSLAAVPQISELAATSRSVLLAARRRPVAPDGPVFYAPSAGMGTLVDAVAAAIVAAGGTIRTSAEVESLRADGAAWRVNDTPADAVVLASPAGPTARLLAGVSPNAATVLRSIPTADVVLISMAVPAASIPEALAGLSGYLVPKPQQRLVTAVSFGSQKWAHWRDPDSQLLRVSLGRDGLPVLHLSDDQLLAAALDEVGHHLGVTLQPSATRISRWSAAFPQYRPHHGDHIAAAERYLPAGLAIAGASYHGIGIPACIASARRAALRVSFRPET